MGQFELISGSFSATLNLRILFMVLPERKNRSLISNQNKLAPLPQPLSTFSGAEKADPGRVCITQAGMAGREYTDDQPERRASEWHLSFRLANAAVAFCGSAPGLLLQDSKDALNSQADAHRRYRLVAEHSYQVVVPAVCRYILKRTNVYCSVLCSSDTLTSPMRILRRLRMKRRKHNTFWRALRVYVW